MADINIVHVVYKGITPTFNDVLGGQVSMIFSGVSSIVPFLKTNLDQLRIASKRAFHGAD